ncbi:unnamed protein product [Effrenium voratum]|uniref:RING-type domain-containing protein n=1 Tax=Effrenium voratum TaxID=2562239 RepID=A0AA36N454_9DINO|nr:unnamed protein product [Effrenium voratum]
MVAEIKQDKADAAEEAKRTAKERRQREEVHEIEIRDSLLVPDPSPARSRKKKKKEDVNVFQDFGKEHDDAPIQETKVNGMVFYKVNYKRYWQSEHDLQRWTEGLHHNIRYENLLYEVRDRWHEDLLGDRLQLKINHNPLARQVAQPAVSAQHGVHIPSAQGTFEARRPHPDRVAFFPIFGDIRRMPFFLGLAAAIPKLAYFTASDALGLAARCLVPLAQGAPGPTINALTSGGIFYGLMGTLTTLLTGVSLGACLGKNALSVARLAAAAYLFDAAGQLVKIVDPSSCTYPGSRTGLLTLFVQLPLAAWILLPDACQELGHRFGERLPLLAGALSLRYMALQAVDPQSSAATLLWGGAALFGLFAVTPRSVWKMLRDLCERIGKVLKYACSSIYAVVTYVLPKIIAAVTAVLQHPFTLRFYRVIVVPLWTLISPLFLPAATFAIGVSCLRSLAAREAAGLDAAQVALLLGQAFSGSAAMLSGFILSLNLWSRCGRRRQPDPLRWAPARYMLMVCASITAGPVGLLRRVLSSIRRNILMPLTEVFFYIMDSLFRFAVKAPVISIPLVLLFNVMSVRRFISTSSTVLESVGYVLSQTRLIGSLLEAAAKMPEGVATDSTLAVLLISLVQVGAYSMVDGVLAVLRVNRGASHALSIEELNNAAALMDNPRQCGRCGLGPIDHRGCSNLRSHHGEQDGGGVVSNACPRCGWFARTLSQWPVWDGELQTEQGRAMYRQRTWCEIVLCISASSKALVVPYSMLLLGNRLQLPSTLSALLAFSYLIPWAVENTKLFLALSTTSSHRMAREPIRQREQRDDADCGARLTEPQLPDITQSEALRNILAAEPTAIFLNEGDICSVCLDNFPCAAAALVSSQAEAESISQICRALREQTPPIVALRCGHALHVECEAEAAVGAAGARHVRCPLCRQPVTLAGAASANMFS